MSWLVVKYVVTAALVVAISELAKRGGKAGALLAALPLVTLLTLVWMQLERQPAQRIAEQAWYTFWYVLPTLPFFVVFPSLLIKLGFWPALLLSAVLAMLCFVASGLLLRHWGINLW
jgi:hypothetical protein